ncbi:MAG TPA: Y-family DNA polymerase [Candidatus Saccharimonadales bacterium]|nr:Y-family DNA polymerase [Candidatus Saccharimonadales bacterium]
MSGVTGAPLERRMKTYALIDCNNFFASCERLFRPELENRPVAVLSSNDGCVVARSNEAKALGIPMGAPAFQWREVFQRHNVTLFSANFAVYGDISKRITALLTTITPRIEVYSVDESFLDITSLDIADYAAWGKMVRAAVQKNIGVPVSIGIAPTKTLAKLASDIGKKQPEYGGVFSFVGLPEEARRTALNSVPVGDVWGVGWRLAPKLKAEGVNTALKLSELRPQHAQQLMGVHGRQMASELNGTACYVLTREQTAAQSIMRSRTFGEDTSEAHVLESAIATLTAQAAFKLRREGLLAKRIGFFTNTNRHKPGYRRWVREIKLLQPANDTGEAIAALVAELGQAFQPGQKYHRLGVFLYDLVPEDALQTDILGQVSVAGHNRRAARMAALDAINQKHGKGKLYYAAEGLGASWQPKHSIRSPRYLSDWDELPEAHIR